MIYDPEDFRVDLAFLFILAALPFVALVVFLLFLFFP